MFVCVRVPVLDYFWITFGLTNYKLIADGHVQLGTKTMFPIGKSRFFSQQLMLGLGLGLGKQWLWVELR